MKFSADQISYLKEESSLSQVEPLMGLFTNLNTKNTLSIPIFYKNENNIEELSTDYFISKADSGLKNYLTIAISDVQTILETKKLTSNDYWYVKDSLINYFNESNNVISEIEFHI